MESEVNIINDIDFSQWKGEYTYTFHYVGNNGDEFTIHARIKFIDNENCFFENWYVKNENPDEKKDFVKIQGNIYPTNDKNKSIEFLEYKTLIGESPNLDPVFKMRKENNEYFINSHLTSPPNNDNVEMGIKKIN